eukprot:380376-Hanusia_phi.AAC.1
MATGRAIKEWRTKREENGGLKNLESDSASTTGHGGRLSLEGSDTSDANAEKRMRNRREGFSVQWELKCRNSKSVAEWYSELSDSENGKIFDHLKVPLVDDEFNYLQTLSHNEQGDTQLDKIMNSIRREDVFDTIGVEGCSNSQSEGTSRLVKKYETCCSNLIADSTSNSLSTVERNSANPSSSKTLMAFVNKLKKKGKFLLWTIWFSYSGMSGLSLIEMFKNIDKDGSGIIERSEFLKALESLQKKGFTKDEIENLWFEIDTDDSNSINYLEFMNAIRSEIKGESSNLHADKHPGVQETRHFQTTFNAVRNPILYSDRRCQIYPSNCSFSSGPEITTTAGAACSDCEPGRARTHISALLPGLEAISYHLAEKLAAHRREGRDRQAEGKEGMDLDCADGCWLF